MSTSRIALAAAAATAVLSLGAAQAAVRTVELVPAGPAPAPLAETVRWAWEQDARGPLLVAPAHPLSPRIEAGEGATTVLALPGQGWLRIAPLAVGPADVADAGLAAGRRLPELAPDGRGLVLRVTDAWDGVDELYALRADALKHDLVVHESVAARLGGRDLRAAWSLSVPEGARLAVEERGGAILRDREGRFLARIPHPLVAEDGDPHYHGGPARLGVSGGEGGVYRVEIRVSGAWLADPSRAYPVLIDPTVSLQPADDLKTGFVDELGARLDDEMVSGTLIEVGFGADCRAFAEFPTDVIPDGATVTDVDLRVWLSNHDNPLDLAVPLTQEVKQCPARASAPNDVLWAAIPAHGTGVIYHSEDIPNTGPEWCPDAYVVRDWDLGAQADADLQARLPLDFFTIGLTSNVVTDPEFDHIDQIGFSEIVNNPFTCPATDLPGSRITLTVTYETNRPPECNAGGPYLSDCPATPIPLDGTGSSDPDGDPLTWQWTTDCAGTIADADQPRATLQLDASCEQHCSVTLAVSDGAATVSCTSPVDAADTTPPEITSSSLDLVCAWPPRHDYLCLADPSRYLTAVDACQPNVTLRWLGCSSDQPDEAPEPGRPENGDGNFTDDCLVSPDGSQICVRVERAGTEPEGRRYGVAVAADDGCGNVAMVVGTVHVPHDRRGGSGGQDDPCVRGGKEKELAP